MSQRWYNMQSSPKGHSDFFLVSAHSEYPIPLKMETFVYHFGMADFVHLGKRRVTIVWKYILIEQKKVAKTITFLKFLCLGLLVVLVDWLYHFLK